MNKQTHEMLSRLEKVLCNALSPDDLPHHGDQVARDDATALRRIGMTLHRWYELECGDGRWHIEREETPNAKPFLVHSASGLKQPTADREAGALKRLAKIMARYPTLTSYVQTDPRGASLYILRPGDVPEGADVSAYYSRGVAVYK